MSDFTAEFIGTGILVLLGNGVVANVVLRETKGHAGGWLLIAAGWGFAVFSAVACVGQFSGAHINPAVTLGLALAGEFPWSRVPPFVLAQFAGAMVGTTLVLLSYYRHYQATEEAQSKLGTFCTIPAIRSPGWNLVTETVATFLLVLVVFYFVPGSVELGGEEIPVGLGSVGALPVGLLVFAIGMSLGGPTGYAINPARDLGPRMAHALLPVPGKGPSDWSYAWVPFFGPLLGGALAAGVKLAAGG